MLASSRPTGTLYDPVISVGSPASTVISTSTTPIVITFVESEAIASLICATIVKASPDPTDVSLMATPDASLTLKLSMKGDFVSTEIALFASVFSPVGSISPCNKFP